jgi:hypothetical protein
MSATTAAQRQIQNSDGGFNAKDVTSNTAITTPSSGVNIISRQKAGKSILSYQAATLREVPLQGLLAAKGIIYSQAVGNGTTISNIGYAPTISGTATARNVATTNIATSARRLGMVSAATAGAFASHRLGVGQIWIGNAAGLGGFFFVTRFVVSQTQTSYRLMVGVGAQGPNGMTNADPSTQGNWVGIGKDAADTTFQAMTANGTPTSTKTNTSITPSTSEIYEVRVFCPPNGSTIYVSIEAIGAGTYFETSFTGANLPSNTTLYGPFIYISNGVTAAAVAIDVINFYCETEF